MWVRPHRQWKGETLIPVYRSIWRCLIKKKKRNKRPHRRSSDRNTGCCFTSNLLFFCTSSKTQEVMGLKGLICDFESFWINLYKIQPVLSVRSVVSTNDVPLFWWCWHLLVRNCSIFYSDVWVYFLIKYIQRNKESKGTKKSMLHVFSFKHCSTTGDSFLPTLNSSQV